MKQGIVFNINTETARQKTFCFIFLFPNLNLYLFLDRVILHALISKRILESRSRSLYRIERYCPLYMMQCTDEQRICIGRE